MSARTARRHVGLLGSGLRETLQRLAEGASGAVPKAPAPSTARQDVLRIARQGRRNALDGLAFLRVARGTLEEVVRLLTRAEALVQEARSNGPEHPKHPPLLAECQTILTTLGELGQICMFNGSPIFTATEMVISLGEDPLIRFTVGPLSPQALGLNPGDIPGDNLALPTGAARNRLPTALASAQERLATLEATMARLASSANRLGLQLENLAAAHRQILEAAITEEIVNLTKFQALQQATVDAQSQFSHASREILVLLRCGQGQFT